MCKTKYLWNKDEIKQKGHSFYCLTVTRDSSVNDFTYKYSVWDIQSTFYRKVACLNASSIDDLAVKQWNLVGMRTRL